MIFTATEIENTLYKTIDFKEYFKELRDYPQEGDPGLDFYSFELLLEDKNQILFAIRNNYRADIYILNLDTFECKSVGNIGLKDVLEGDSLYLRAISMDKIVFQYRADDENNINGIYSILDKKIIDQFQSTTEYDYLYLTDRYYFLSNDPYYWDQDKEEWIFNPKKDKLYLWDRDEDRSYEIFDNKLKNSYHTSANHFIRRYGNKDYLLNFPFNMDPEDFEAIIKDSKRSQAWDESNEISFILLEKFVESIKTSKKIPFELLYSWDKDSFIDPYFYFNYESKSLAFSVFDLKNNTIEVLDPLIKNKELNIKQVLKADYSDLKTCKNINYMGKKIVLAFRNDRTEILTPIRKTVRHSSRETLVDFNEKEYLIDGWSEDEDGFNFKQYMIIKDSDGKEIARLDNHFIKLEYGNILIGI